LRSQLNEFNELRLGIDYKIYDLMMNFQGGATGEQTAIINYRVKPNKFAIFLTDKIETDGMIINAGLRYDYFNPQAILPEDFTDPVVTAAKHPGYPLYWDVNATAEERIKNPKAARSTSLLMPRIGISFPITELDVIHINYGHYFAPPPLGDIYHNYSWSLSYGAYGWVGNPELQAEKNILYEVGLEHGFNRDIKLRGTVFYKDIADLIDESLYRDQLTGDPYRIKTNADFANVYGFELSLITRRWHNLLAQANYTYQFANGKSSNSESAYNDNVGGRQPRTESFPLDWDVRHTVNVNIDYRVPPKWLGSRWLDDWGLSTILTFNSGRPWTSPRQPPPPANLKINDQRYPSWLNVNLRFFKNFALWQQIRLGVFLEIYNLFNDRTLREIVDPSLYYDDLDDGDGPHNTPYVWAEPRHYRLGFEIVF
jgi:outer membrane receptor for Fe3+-dicitrate